MGFFGDIYDDLLRNFSPSDYRHKKTAEGYNLLLKAVKKPVSHIVILLMLTKIICGKKIWFLNPLIRWIPKE